MQWRSLDWQSGWGWYFHPDLGQRVFGGSDFSRLRNVSNTLKFNPLKILLGHAGYYYLSWLNGTKLRFNVSNRARIVSQNCSRLGSIYTWLHRSNFRFHAFSPEASVPVPHFPFPPTRKEFPILSLVVYHKSWSFFCVCLWDLASHRWQSFWSLWIYEPLWLYFEKYCHPSFWGVFLSTFMWKGYLLVSVIEKLNVLSSSSGWINGWIFNGT